MIPGLPANILPALLRAAQRRAYLVKRSIYAERDRREQLAKVREFNSWRRVPPADVREMETIPCE